ncbi:MAG: dihydrolipoyl dehydrogenase [Gammaproteobacteria bacterium]|nr:dihydrolipoyl dehydrogenase [Gammaproteobacteria bacterium]TVQ45282.1 MAG: dihydrolipoyl dehydrogenase [Gammaproteobacteria bacterium]
MKKAYDVIVIGGGPAGYPAAIRAAQHGLSAACIDDWQNYDGSRSFGGTCLNAGCIPSKAMLESSELVHRAHDEFAAHGIKVGKVEVDLARMQKRKAGIVRQLTGGIEMLLKANKVDGLQGHGRLLPDNRVEYTDPDGKAHTLEARDVIIATGSTPIELSSVPFDGERVVDSWGSLEFTEVPGRLGVIGAGVIGLELGSVWRRLGAEVTVLEALDSFLPMADKAVAKEAQKHFKRQGLDIRLGAKVSAAEVSDKGVTLSYTDAKGEQSLEVDRVIVCVGRRPYTEGLCGEGVALAMDKRGFIEVDEHCRTALERVWAVGDCVRGPMLAHKATEEGVMVADLIAGEVAEVNYNVIPSVIYTAPEIAWVGRTEQQLADEGVDFKIGQVPFGPNGRAKAMEQSAGFVRILADKTSDEILGVHIIGPMAGELIAEAVLAMEYQASAEDLQRTVHAHPTLAEVLHEAALAADGKAIHALNK